MSKKEPMLLESIIQSWHNRSAQTRVATVVERAWNRLRLIAGAVVVKNN